jgi:PadR family transcriptional regulator PadR
MRRHGRAARSRGGRHPASWRVRARIERFVEPAALLLLREGPAHGYDLLERLGEIVPGERIDMGNLYRVLRALEEDGLVRSQWDADAPGPARRMYELAPAGARVLDDWAAALSRSRDRIDAFLQRYDEGRR